MENQSHKILLVDDEPDILEFLEYNFKNEGFQVTTASNGTDAVKIATAYNPDLILLDIMMPGLDGIETCIKLREIPQLAETIIIFLTARGEDYSEVAGFEVGADDYITKPVRPKVILARVKSILKRRIKSSKINTHLSFKNISINLEKREVYVNDEKVKLPKKEFDLLYLFASDCEKVFNRDEIYRKIWGSKVIVGDRTLDVHIRKLRKKIGENFIKTSKGIGYYFEG